MDDWRKDRAQRAAESTKAPGTAGQMKGSADANPSFMQPY
ncbi:hypothetical protein SAMN04487769_0895 [Burkholderia sp. b14]|nr:hypothetical protein SAMN04487769_0895 [Burkholderia sp. b14]